MKKLILVSTLLWGSVAMAQVDASMHGSWSAKFTTLTGNPAEAALKIGESESSWQSLGRSPNPCISRKFPMDVHVPNADSAVLKIYPSRVVNGCEDMTLEFKRTGPNSFEGQLPDGRKITLTR